MSLTEHRQAIDQLDAQIVKLLNERTRHVLAIGEIKLRPARRFTRRTASAPSLNASARTMPGR